jgi:cytochrome oxidase assembly protein ShyY1
MASPATVGLSPLGKAFFGSLTAGTFCLGCWQTQRYFEKQQLVAQRQHDLSLEPEPLTSDYDLNVLRRKWIEGTYSHEKEALVGPRGPPPGAMAASGPSSGRNQGGMSSSPQVKQ